MLRSIPIIATLAASTFFGTSFASRANQFPTTQALNPDQGDGGVSVFYLWDKPIPRTPGSLLRQEPLPEDLQLRNASKSLRVLYTSIDGVDGKRPITVSGSVFFPKGAPPSGGWPVIAWAHGTTGVADVCAPSWMERSQRDTDYLNAWLAQGYAIVATDYQGLGTAGPHPWLIAKAESNSVLDSVRAALAGFPNLANSVVIVGQSQGAHAALSAALLAPGYSSEIQLKGIVATGVPNRPPLTVASKAPQIAIPDRSGGGLNAVSTMLITYSFMAIDDGFRPPDYLSDVAKPVFEKAATACLTDLIRTATDSKVTVENTFKKQPDSSEIKPYMQYADPKFVEPVFIGAGLADVTALPEGQYDFAMAACFDRSIVETHYYSGKDHSSAVLASLTDSVPFVRKAFAGQSIAGNCSTLKPPIPER